MPIHASSRRQRGFTLIETMIAVGIAGVLSSIAYPSLEGHVLRARRIDALASLMSAQLAQERTRIGARVRRPGQEEVRARAGDTYI